MEVSETIRKIISVRTGVPPQKLSADMPFRMLPEIDSMGLLQIVLETENAFGIEIPDHVTFHIQSIGEYEELVEELCRQSSPA